MLARTYALQTTSRTPTFAVFANPIEQRAFKSNIVAQALGFEPLVLQNFLPLGEELLIQVGLLDELA